MTETTFHAVRWPSRSIKNGAAKNGAALAETDYTRWHLASGPQMTLCGRLYRQYQSPPPDGMETAEAGRANCKQCLSRRRAKQ